MVHGRIERHIGLSYGSGWLFQHIVATGTTRKMPHETSFDMVSYCVHLLSHLPCRLCFQSTENLVQRHDHAGLKGWYLVEAATLRGKAEEMRQRADEYRRQQTRPGFPSELAQHCENLVERYTTAAKDAEALAEMHASHPLSGPGNTQPTENIKLFSF